MRLLHSKPDGDFELKTFNDNEAPPPYAILSHTWLVGEVIYDEIMAGEGKNKAGYAKLRFCVKRAAKDNLEYFWVDTCCINKLDNNELTTALNSMFRWYQRAAKCYVYLSDVHIPEEVTDIQEFRITWEYAFRTSRWFQRGWTLQELLAPASVEFFSANGKRLGSKMSLEQEIHEITKIPISALRKYNLDEFSVDERMSWAASRKTTVEEDRAYCLLGIFGVFLPWIYGEGEKHALERLQREIQAGKESLNNVTAATTNNISVSTLLPFPRNEFFVGREHHLRTLEDMLCSSNTHRRMSLYGLGGGGKTAVALELAYRMVTKRPQFLVFWVPAISRDTFEIAYREIGTLLGIQGIADDNANIKQLVKDGLDSGKFSDWLMIIDNADDSSVLINSANDGPQSGPLHGYLPRSDRGSILFTTRTRKAAEDLTPSNTLELEDMSEVGASQLMARRIKNKKLLDDEDAAEKLIRLLAYLPLAIVQAVAFINSNEVSISDYVSLFEQADTEVEVFSEHFHDPNRYREMENTIAKTWQISFDKIKEKDQLAADYLSFMACIDRVNIPLSLLPDRSTLVQRVKAIGTLTAYAFISERQQSSQQQEKEKYFDIHRLVQKATIWWLKEHKVWTLWKERAHERLIMLIPNGGHEGRQKWINYLPHALHVSGIHIELNETRMATLLSQIGQCQYTLGQYSAAEKIHRQALSLRRKNLGEEDVSTLKSMHEWGAALVGQGRCDEAENTLRHITTIYKKMFGEEHPNTLATESTLALSLTLQDKHDEADTISRHTIAIYKKMFGEEHPNTLASESNLGLSLFVQDKYDEAETMLRHILPTCKKVFGEEHPTTLRSEISLVLSLLLQDKHDEAETMLRHILPRCKKVFGEEHPDTLRSETSLVLLLLLQDKHHEAETISRHLLVRYEKVLGEKHPETLNVMDILLGMK